jgi:hypothetical protein
MAKVTIHLEEKEHNALNELALREYRTLPAQAAIIIHRQLIDLGLLPGQEEDQVIMPNQISKNATEVGCD